jgi:DNA-directed RNA polymerase specialized sigma24 family protein
MNQGVLDKISQLDWNQISRRLMAVSIFWSKMYHGEDWKCLPKGFTQDDVVQESIRRAFSRDWNEYDENAFINFLMGAVRSIVSNLAKSAKNQKTDSMDLFDLEIEGDDIEMKFEKDDVIESIRTKAKDDRLLTQLLDCTLLGLEPQEISDRLQLPVIEVYKAKKRLIRIVEKVAKEIKGHGKKEA